MTAKQKIGAFAYIPLVSMALWHITSQVGKFNIEVITDSDSVQ
jgi:hypothetical protein